MIEMMSLIVRVLIGAMSCGVCIMFILYGAAIILHGLRAIKYRDWDYICLCIVMGFIIIGVSGVFGWLTIKLMRLV